MAANNLSKIQTLNLPTDVQDSDWRDDIDIDYAIYGNTEKQEGEFISPSTVSKESIEKIKSFQEKLAISGLKKFRTEMLSRSAA